MTAEYQIKSLETVSTFSSDIHQCQIQILLSTDKSIQCQSLLKIFEIALNIPKPIGTFLLPIAAQRYWITHNLHHEMAETRCHYSRPTWSNSQLWVQIGIQGFAQNLWQEKYTKIFVLGFHGILKTTRRFSHHVIWYSRGSSRGMTVLADQNTNTTRVMSMVITLWVPLTKYHIPSPSSWMVVTSCNYSCTDMGFISLAVTSCNYSCANMDFIGFNSQRKVGVDKYTIIC